MVVQRDGELVPGEMRLIGEYVARQYADALLFLRLRLGDVKPLIDDELTPAELRGVTNAWRRWADAVAVRPDELILIEAKMRAEPGALAQLELYRKLLPLTPEMRPYLGRPLVMELLVAITDPAVELLAREKGIRVKVYTPAWLPEWQARRTHRATRAPRSGGLLAE